MQSSYGAITDVELHRLISLREPPAFVKAASEAGLRGDRGLPAHAFADRPGRGLPLHTAAATWLSAARFFAKEASGRDPEAAARIEAAADYWGVGAAVAVLKKADGPAPDPGASHAWAARLPGGAVERRLPLRDAGDVKLAAAYLGRYRDRFAYEDRRDMARRVLAKAAQLGMSGGVDLEPLERTAGYGACATAAAVGLLLGRAAALPRAHAKHAAALREAAGLVRELGATAPVLAKAAAAVDQVDRACGLQPRYGDDLAYPEDVLFAVTEKVASDFAAAHVETATGARYRVGDLARLKLAQVRAYVGDEFAEAVGDGLMVDAEKLAAVLPTAPRADAAAFDRLAEAAGVAPARKTAAARRPRAALRDFVAGP